MAKRPKAATPPDTFPRAETAALLATAFRAKAAPRPTRQQLLDEMRAKTGVVSTWDTPTPKPRQSGVRLPRRGLGKPYRVVGFYRAKRNTWTAYMVRTISDCTDTAAAMAAHRAAGLYADKTLDFNWAAKVGLISWEGA